MKTTVSLPNRLFIDVEAAARALKISRSQLYVRALEAFLATQVIDPVTSKLDELADERGTPGMVAGRYLIDRELWKW